eukprot:8799768-Alexandrium_andersonii.AAC.1
MMTTSTVICRYRHRVMVLTILMAMAGRPKSAQLRAPELSMGPFCAGVRRSARVWQREAPREFPGAR